MNKNGSVGVFRTERFHLHHDVVPTLIGFRIQLLMNSHHSAPTGFLVVIPHGTILRTTKLNQHASRIPVIQRHVGHSGFGVFSLSAVFFAFLLFVGRFHFSFVLPPPGFAGLRMDSLYDPS